MKEAEISSRKNDTLVKIVPKLINVMDPYYFSPTEHIHGIDSFKQPLK